MNKKLPNGVIYILLIIATLFWGASYVWYKVVFTELKPVTVMVIRLSISALLLGLFAKATKQLQTIGRKDYRIFLLMALFEPFLYFLFEGYGVDMSSATVSAVIISTIPIFTPVAARIFQKTKISLLNVLGIFISFVGVLMVVLGKDLSFQASPIGLLLLFGAVFSAVGYAIVIAKLTIEYTPLTLITWQNILGAVYFLPLFLFMDASSLQQSNFTWSVITNVFYLAVFGSSLAFLLFIVGMKQIGITKATLFTNVIPVFTAILAYFTLGETISWIKMLGIAVVLSGLFLGQVSSK